MKQRSYLKYSADVELDIKPVFVWGYGRSGLRS